MRSDIDKYLSGAMPYATDEALPINALLGGNDYDIYQHIEPIGDFHIALQDFLYPSRYLSYMQLEVFELLSCPLGSILYRDHPSQVSRIGYFRDVSITWNFKWPKFTMIGGGGWGR
jgi:hypothetical protein